MKTVADLVSARTASFCSEVLGGSTPRAMREVRERGRRRSSMPRSSCCWEREEGFLLLVGDLGSVGLVRMEVSAVAAAAAVAVEGAAVVVVGEFGLDVVVGAAVAVMEAFDFRGGIVVMCDSCSSSGDRVLWKSMAARMGGCRMLLRVGRTVVVYRRIHRSTVKCIGDSGESRLANAYDIPFA